VSDQPQDPSVQKDADIVELLEDLIERMERGEPVQATLRLKMKDGTVQVLEIGYDSDEERDAAMAKIMKVLGELH
jgi:uncharacterized protein (UPF0335 family)